MAKVKMKTSETVSIVCYVLQMFLENILVDLSLPVLYLIKVALCVPLAVCIYNSKPKLLFGIAAVVSLLLFSAPSSYLSQKVNIIIYIIAAVFAGIVSVVSYKKQWRKKADITSFALSLILFLGIMNGMNQRGYYTHTESTFNSTIICWAIAFFLGVGYFFFMINKNLTQAISAHFCTALVLFLFSGMFISSTYYNLNYVLDTEKPQEYSVKIENISKSFVSGKINRYHYYLRFSIKGEEYKIKIPSKEYNRYKVGDSYIVYYYNGAFDQPFFISGKYRD